MTTRSRAATYLGVGIMLGALVVSGCGHGEPPGPLPGAVATHRGGTVSLEQVEEALRLSGDLRAPSVGLAALVTRYRNGAESLVLERVLVQEDTGEELLAQLGQDGVELERELIVAAFLQTRLKVVSISTAELEELYESKREELKRKDQRMVQHLFRRHRDPARPDETIELLRSLKRRVEAGEGFGKLAEQYSDSETRVVGGRLGLLERGRLPQHLEDIVFSVRAGGVSEPIEVPRGAALFYVSEVFEARQYSLDDARPTLLAHLRDERQREQLTELVRDRQPPEGSTVLSSAALATAAVEFEDDRVILEIGERQFTAGQLRERLDASTPSSMSLLALSSSDRLQRTYEDMVTESLVLLAAREAPLSEAEVRFVDGELVRRGREALLRQRLEARMRERVTRDEAALKAFHVDNRHLYQTPLRLRLRSLTVDAGPKAPRQLAQLEALYGELAIGAIDLPTAAQRAGGAVVDLGWLDYEGLQSFEPKVRHYVLDLNGPGYTVPFQLSGRLGLIWVEEREEPAPLPFELVRTRVEQDFYDRSQERLYRETVDEILAAEGFRFFEEAVREALAGPTADMPA